jgi:hypothetical protein
MFMVIGSAGVGPTNVRLDGARRRDVIGELFTDSDLEDESLPEEPFPETDETLRVVASTPQGAEGTSEDPSSTTSVLTPHASQKRPRPRETQRPSPWTPEDPRKLLGNYKKGTPVYNFPGYEGILPLAPLATSSREDVNIGGNDRYHIDLTMDEDGYGSDELIDCDLMEDYLRNDEHEDGFDGGLVEDEFNLDESWEHTDIRNPDEASEASVQTMRD